MIGLNFSHTSCWAMRYTQTHEEGSAKGVSKSEEGEVGEKKKEEGEKKKYIDGEDEEEIEVDNDEEEDEEEEEEVGAAAVVVVVEKEVEEEEEEEAVTEIGERDDHSVLTTRSLAVFTPIPCRESA